MKKLVFFLLMVFCIGAMQAQHVLPLDIKLVEFDLDTLRGIYANNPSSYLLELQRIMSAQDANDAAIKTAQKQLKEETAFAKAISAVSKEAASATKTMNKAYQNEQKVLTSLRNVLEKQYQKIQKMTNISAESKNAVLTSISKDKQVVEKDIQRVTMLLKDISAQEIRLEKGRSEYTTYSTEVANKTLDLKHLIETQKINKKTISGEIKTVKATIKDAKKQ